MCVCLCVRLCVCLCVCVCVCVCVCMTECRGGKLFARVSKWAGEQEQSHSDRSHPHCQRTSFSRASWSFGASMLSFSLLLSSAASRRRDMLK
jgi:hypothetical protein